MRDGRNYELFCFIGLAIADPLLCNRLIATFTEEPHQSHIGQDRLLRIKRTDHLDSMCFAPDYSHSKPV